MAPGGISAGGHSSIKSKCLQLTGRAALRFITSGAHLLDSWQAVPIYRHKCVSGIDDLANSGNPCDTDWPGRIPQCGKHTGNCLAFGRFLAEVVEELDRGHAISGRYGEFSGYQRKLTGLNLNQVPSFLPSDPLHNGRAETASFVIQQRL